MTIEQSSLINCLGHKVLRQVKKGKFTIEIVLKLPFLSMLI